MSTVTQIYYHYGAFTQSHSEEQHLIRYVENQEMHHRTTDFREEFSILLIEAGIELYEKYLE